MHPKLPSVFLNPIHNGKKTFEHYKDLVRPTKNIPLIQIFANKPTEEDEEYSCTNSHKLEACGLLTQFLILTHL